MPTRCSIEAAQRTTPALKLTLISVSLLLATACSDGSFNSGSGRAADGRSEAGRTDPSQSSSVDDDRKEGDETGPGEESSREEQEEREAIGKCLAKWGQHPFGSEPAFRKIHASVQVFGKGRGIVDDISTPGPELVLISAAVNVLGKSTYQLLNPNGWYCLKTDVNVVAGTTVELACSARLADNKVDVSVGSDSRPVGIVGVHVFSNIDVKRVKRDGASCP